MDGLDQLADNYGLQHLQRLAPLSPMSTGDDGSDSAVQVPQAAPQASNSPLPEDYMPMGFPAKQPLAGMRNYFIGPQQAADIASSLPSNDPAMENYLTNLIRAKESSGNYQAVNPHSTASGAYQYTDSTWNGYGGYAKAALAPAAVQDAKFRQDVAARLAAYGGDPYKAIVAHYLPALANQPQRWAQPFKVGGRVVKPALSYLQYVIKGSPLEEGLHAYLTRGIVPQPPQGQQLASVD